jgi:hypothetical protein
LFDPGARRAGTGRCEEKSIGVATGEIQPEWHRRGGCAVRTAERDTKFVTLLEDAGAARSAPDEQLYQAYLIMMKARELCSSGRFAEGIAVYDTITVAPPHAVAR